MSSARRPLDKDQVIAAQEGAGAGFHSELGCTPYADIKKESVETEFDLDSLRLPHSSTGGRRSVVTGRSSVTCLESVEEVDNGIGGENHSLVRASLSNEFGEQMICGMCQKSLEDQHRPTLSAREALVPNLEASLSSQQCPPVDHKSPSSIDDGSPDRLSDNESRGSSIDRVQSGREDPGTSSSSLVVHKRFSLGDHDSINTFIQETFLNAYQSELKPILKRTIKFIEPNKQKKWPYVLSADSTKKNSSTKHRRDHGIDGNPQPPWWPSDVRYREPDHLRKFENARLAIALLWHVIKDEELNRKHHYLAVKKLYVDYIESLLKAQEQDDECDDEEAPVCMRQQCSGPDGQLSALNEAALGAEAAPLTQTRTDHNLEIERNKELAARRKAEITKKAEARRGRLKELYRLALNCSNACFGERDMTDLVHIEYLEPGDDIPKLEKAAVGSSSLQGQGTVDTDQVIPENHAIAGGKRPCNHPPPRQGHSETVAESKKRKATGSTVDTRSNTRKRLTQRKTKVARDLRIPSSSSSRSSSARPEPRVSDARLMQIEHESLINDPASMNIAVDMTPSHFVNNPYPSTHSQYYQGSIPPSLLSSWTQQDASYASMQQYAHIDSSLSNLSSHCTVSHADSAPMIWGALRPPPADIINQYKLERGSSTTDLDQTLSTINGLPLTSDPSDWDIALPVSPMTANEIEEFEQFIM